MDYLRGQNVRCSQENMYEQWPQRDQQPVCQNDSSNPSVVEKPLTPSLEITSL